MLLIHNYIKNEEKIN